MNDPLRQIYSLSWPLHGLLQLHVSWMAWIITENPTTYALLLLLLVLLILLRGCMLPPLRSVSAVTVDVLSKFKLLKVPVFIAVLAFSRTDPFSPPSGCLRIRRWHNFLFDAILWHHFARAVCAPKWHPHTNLRFIWHPHLWPWFTSSHVHLRLWPLSEKWYDYGSATGVVHFKCYF